MKKLIVAFSFAVALGLLLSTFASAVVTNGDFELGNLSGWTLTSFFNLGINSPPYPGSANDLSAVVGGPAVLPLSTPDPNTNGVVKYPAYGHYSARINNEESYYDATLHPGYGKNANVLSQNITAVLQPDGFAHVHLAYAAVMAEPGPSEVVHTSEEKPYFRVRVINNSNGGDVIYDFSSYVGEPGKNWQTGPHFATTIDDVWKYLDWTYLDLKSSVAHPVTASDSLTIEVTAAGCSLGGHPGYVYLDDVSDDSTTFSGPWVEASGPATALSGNPITYTYTYGNGSASSVNATITATEPVGVTFQSVSDVSNCSLTAGTVTCNYTGLAAGASGSFTITGLITAPTGSRIAHGDYDIAAAGFPTLGGPTVYTNIYPATVTINQTLGGNPQLDPTSSSPILFTAVFSNPVTGFTGADVNLTASTQLSGLSAAVSELAPNDGTTYKVAVTGMNISGNVIASINAGVVPENNVASTSTDNSVTFVLGTATPTVTITSTSTVLATATQTLTKTLTPTKTLTVTSTLTGSATFTPTPTPTGSITFTPTPTRTGSATFTQTPTPTGSINFTPTPTRTGSATFTATRTQTSTATLALTATQTNTGTSTPTRTRTATATVTPTVTPTLLAPVTIILTSIASQDGRLLESAENSGVGGSLNTDNKAITLGDYHLNEQYRSIVSFDTSVIPNTATVLKVTLILKFETSNFANADDIVTAFDGFMVDTKTGFFGTTNALELADFNAATSGTYGPELPKLANGYFNINMNPERSLINILGTNGGLTQMRLRFRLTDDNDFTWEWLRLGSSDALDPSYHPQLVITYQP